MLIFWRHKNFLIQIQRDKKKKDLLFHQELIMKENGQEIKEMEKEKWYGLMKLIMMENGYKIE